MRVRSAWVGLRWAGLVGVLVAVSAVVVISAGGGVGAAGPCTIMGTAGDDVLVGTPGDDVICGLRGDDRLVGRGGDDSLFGDGGNDVVVGGPGDDLVRGGVGDDVVSGGNGDDRLRGKSGDDELSGGRGNDNLHGGEGSDVVQGGAGRDVASYTGQSTGVRASIGDGANDGGRGEGDDIGSGVEDLRGGRGGDVLVGSAGANRLFGSRGGDRLVGLGGDDRLIGGAGSDRLDGRDSAGFVDVLRCGPGGGDRVLADMGDRVGGGCESVVQNDPPTNIVLVPASVAENRPAGTTVGTLTTTDPDAGDNHSYTLVAGAGSADNGSFTIAGTQLVTDASFDFETDSSLSVRVRSSDGLGGSFTRALTVSVTDVVENNPPTAIALDNTTVAENQPAATPVGTLSTTDPDAGDAHSYTLVTASGCAGGDNGLFTITGDLLQTAAGLDFEDDADLDVCVRSSDGRGGTLAVPFTITVTDVNDAPTAITLDNTTVAENEPAGTTVGVLSAADQDDGDSHTFMLVAGAGDTDNGSFAIAGDELVTTASFDFEIEDSLSVRVEATDAAGASVEQQLTITVTDVNEAPTAIALDNTLVAENVPAGATVGTFTTTDPDTDTHTYSLVAGAGDTDNSSFAIDGDELVTAAVFDFEIDDTFSVRVRSTDSGGESVEAQFTITVTNVNDAPTAITLDNTTVAENEPAGTTVGVLSATDQDTDTHTFTLVAGAGDTDNSSFAINGNELVTDAVFDFETDNTFSVRVRATDSGGATFDQQFTITVTNLNDAPTAITLDNTTVAENEPVGTTVGTLSAVDQDTDTHTFTLVAGPGDTDNSSFTINGDELVTAASFDADTDDTLTIRVQATDSGGASFEQQFTITVTNLNEAPSIVAPATISAERDEPTVVAGVSVADPDTGDIELTLTAGNGTIDVDETASPADVTGDGTNTVIITGTVTEINTILGAPVIYLNDVGFTGASDSVQLDVDDLATPALTATATITIQFNQPPVADDVTATTDEGTPVIVTLSASDGDDDDLTFTITAGPDGGTLGPIGVPDCATVADVCTAQVTYTPTGDFNGADEFSYQVDDGAATDTGTAAITVAPVNDAPVITLSGSTPSYTENGAAVTVDGGLTVTDVDDTDLVSGTVSITAPVTGDTLTFISTGGITDTNPAPEVLALTGTTSITNWQTVLRSVQYSTTSDNPTDTTRTVSFTVNDGDLASNTAAKQVTVVPVNDPPVLTQPDTTALAYTENDTATVITPNIGVTDPDSTNLVSATVDIGTGHVAGQDVLSLGMNPQNGITATFNPATGTLSLSGTSTIANYQTALRDVRYANTSHDPTAATRTVTVQVDDGAIADNQSNTVTRDVTVTPVNDPPDAVDDSFTGANAALANTRLAVGTTASGPHLTAPGNVLANDTDVDSPAAGFTAGPATISSANCAGCDNVTMNADGSFLYDPPAGFTGNDTFTYTVNDNDTETPANQTDTATVTVEVVGPVVWYVDIDAAAPPAGQGGRSHSPFNSLAPLTTGGSADTLDGNGHTIFLDNDDATVTGHSGGIVLETNQRLWGEPFGLTVDPDGPRPSTTLVAATGTTNPNVFNTGGVGITLANGVDIQRVNAGVAGTASTTGVQGTGVTTATIGANTLIQGNTTGITLTGAAGGNIDVGAAINGNTGTVVNVANRSSGTVTFSGNLTGSAATSAITLTGNTGAAVNITGAVNVNSTNAATTAFNASGGGTITANNAANQVATFAGTGINLNGVAIGAAGMTFATVSSAVGGAANGILLTNVAGTNPFTVNGGAITATTRALDIDGGSGNVTIGADLATSGAAARSVEVTNRTGGTVDINGLVTENSTGINLSTNGTGLVRFDGGINASTGTNLAFASAVSGNLAITDTNGPGTAPNNTLTTTTGTALNVQNTAIHADGLTFQSISANGGANGIVLSNTGTAGGLTVTGNGGTCTNANTSGCSGGVIQNTIGADNSGATPPGTGIVLNNTRSISLTRVHIQNHQNYGIRGTSVTGFVLGDSVLNGTNGTSDVTGIRDSTVRFIDLSGTVSVTNSDLSGGYTNNFVVVNSSGALNATFSSNDFGSVSTAGGDDSLQVQGLGTSEVDATIQNSTFNSARGDIFQYIGNGSGGGDLVFTGNTVTNTHPAIATGGGGITISGSAAGPVTVDFSNNTMRDALTHALTIVKSLGSGSFTATISENSIGDFAAPLDPNAGSLEGAGMEITHFGGGNATFNITNNQIRQYNSFGISIVAGGGVTESGQFNFNISGNTISNEGTNPNITLFQGIGINSGVTPGDTFQTCVNFGANSIAGAGSDTIPDSDFRMRARQNTTIRLPGYAGGAVDGTAAATFAEGRIGGGAQGTAAALDSGTFIGSGTTCP